MVNEREPAKTTDELRGGSAPGVTRYVLAASIALIIIVFAVLLFAYR